MSGSGIGKTLLERFHEKYIVDNKTQCWNWIGAKWHNYGQIRINGYDKALAHRVSYELFVGEIPSTLVIDHICNNTYCVNPKHLRAITIADNLKRAYLPGCCKNGHIRTMENTYVRPSGHKKCKDCKKASYRKMRGLSSL